MIFKVHWIIDGLAEIEAETKEQAEKKIQALKKDLFNLRFKKVNNQINNPAQFNQIRKRFQNARDER